MSSTATNLLTKTPSRAMAPGNGPEHVRNDAVHEATLEGERTPPISANVKVLIAVWLDAG